MYLPYIQKATSNFNLFCSWCHINDVWRKKKQLNKTSNVPHNWLSSAQHKLLWRWVAYDKSNNRCLRFIFIHTEQIHLKSISHRFGMQFSGSGGLHVTQGAHYPTFRQNCISNELLNIQTVNASPVSEWVPGCHDVTRFK